jgi:hypothetical protein
MPASARVRELSLILDGPRHKLHSLDNRRSGKRSQGLDERIGLCD